MPWLSSLLKKPEPETAEVVEEKPSLPTGPQLAVLVPDIAGISSFRLRLFPDAARASEYLESLRPDIRHNAHGFWALQYQPDLPPDRHVETLVLIRSAQDSDMVYVVSFLDLESALSFTRFEVRRGLTLTNVMIYCAAFAEFSENEGRVLIAPPVAPRPRAFTPEVRQQQPAPAVEERPAAPPPEQPRQPEKISVAEADAQDAIEEYLRREADQEASGVEDLGQQVENVSPTIEPPVVRPRMRPADLTPPQEPQSAEPEDELFSEVPEEQAALREAFVFSHPITEQPQTDGPVEPEQPLEEDSPDDLALRTAAATNGVDHQISAGGPAVAEPEEDIDEDVVSFPGDDERMPDRAPFAQPASSTAGAPTAEPPETKPLSDFDVAFEVERLLRNRRWRDNEEEPFGGFKSPPGRF